MIYSVILAGGKGERFWPLSRKNRPKQLLKLASDKTMLQETIDRILPLAPLDKQIIVTGRSISQAILDEIDYLKEENLLVEPEGKNTLYAIGLAAVHIEHDDPAGVMVVLSADHLINPPERLREIIKFGASLAATENKLITIGIVPTRAETGYGYIKLGEVVQVDSGVSVHKVVEFTEKPQRLLAQKYFYGREHLWNSGMFIWTVKAIMAEIEQHCPDAFKLLREYASVIGKDNENAAREKLYKAANAISIDFAVLEKAENTLTMRADIVWDDVGSWNALERFMEPDTDRNVVIGNVALSESYELTVYNESDGLIAALGVSDLVIVRSGNTTLVAHKTKVGELKSLLKQVSQLKDHEKYF
ncbi:MAG: mannose-1-phosphate guanylyltransferase [candidate division Zixibacteria bacterium]|nr:mannose-1-phosphate guanylyltransferase [candidate division Zixibacteria bacterium]